MAKYPKHRMLGRKSSHRIALLRNLVTSLFLHESIQTTFAKAKAAQRVAERLITLGKKGTVPARVSAERWVFRPMEILPKLFGPLATRYSTRPGGYTRVLRTEPKNTHDQAESAILELVDGSKDVRFALTAKTVASCLEQGKELNEITLKNIKKVTAFRPAEQFERMVEMYRKNPDGRFMGKIAAEVKEEEEKAIAT